MPPRDPPSSPPPTAAPTPPRAAASTPPRAAAPTPPPSATSTPPRAAASTPPPAAAPTPPPTTAPTLAERLATARALAGAGRVNEALDALAALTAHVPLNVEAWVLAALVAHDAGQAASALESARRAHLLAAEEPIVRYLFAIGLQAVGQVQRARGLLHLATDALAGRDPEAPLPYGQGLTTTQLRRMIDARLDAAR